MSGKLKVLVRVDLECASARIEVRGSVDERNVLAVYSLANRANGLAPGLEISVDLQGATVDEVVLGQLQACAEAEALPAHVDPRQAECRLRVLAPALKSAADSVALAA